MATPHKDNKISSKIRLLLLLVISALSAFTLGSHWKTVASSFRTARHAELGWLLMALLLTSLTYVIAAAIYTVLALKRLKYPATLLVELSTAFVNRLLPSGIGGLGIHGVYLYRHKHTVSEATAVVSVNNLLGISAHLLLLISVFVFHPSVVDAFTQHFHLRIDGRLVAVVVAILIASLSLTSLKRRIMRFMYNVLTSVRRIGHRKALRALVLALLLTVTYTAILSVCARATGIRIGTIEIFIVFSIGMLLGTAAPTPGGLVGAEAGLFAGLVGYGVPSAEAGATVVLYRLATYWLPLLPGAVALVVARRRRLV